MHITTVFAKISEECAKLNSSYIVFILVTISFRTRILIYASFRLERITIYKLYHSWYRENVSSYIVKENDLHSFWSI